MIVCIIRTKYSIYNVYFYNVNIINFLQTHLIIASHVKVFFPTLIKLKFYLVTMD